MGALSFVKKVILLFLNKEPIMKLNKKKAYSLSELLVVVMVALWIVESWPEA